MNADQLRVAVRALLASGVLPDGRPDRTWGGRGADFSCAVCSAAVGSEELEIEAYFGSQVYHLHTECFMTWQEERQRG